MKDIQREVKALEVAMEVATDIQDKPYAYVVARIQEAILGVNAVEERVESWKVAEADTGTTKTLQVSTPQGHTYEFRLPSATNMTTVIRFVEDFSCGDRNITKCWQIVMPDSGAVYLRTNALEIPLGVITRDSEARAVLVRLAHYLDSL